MKNLFAFVFIFYFNSILYGQEIYKVIFTAGTTQYYSALALFDNGQGQMRTKFYRTSCECTVMVEQTIRVENTNVGMRITGYNPVYPNTSNKFPNYSADNFYISRDYNGKLQIINIDDQGTSASATILHVSQYTEKMNFLSEFNWRLN